MNKFFDGEFWTFGIDVLKYMDADQEDRMDPMIYIFPRMTKCTFYKYGVSGEVSVAGAIALAMSGLCRRCGHRRVYTCILKRTHSDSIINNNNHNQTGRTTRRHMHIAAERGQRENLHMLVVLVHHTDHTHNADAHLSTGHHCIATDASVSAEAAISVSVFAISVWVCDLSIDS